METNQQVQMGSYQLMLYSKARGCGSRADTKLVVNRTEMAGDGTGTDDELRSHLSVG